MNINVLIMSASRKVSLVKAFQIALQMEGGGDVVALDASPNAAALYFANKYFIAPSGLGEDYWEFLRIICVDEAIRLIIPTRDEELPVISVKREIFESLGAAVMVPDPETVDVCQDKRAFLDFCIDNGFSIPKLLRPGMISHFPVFVRNRRGKGSRTAFRCDSEAELNYLLEQLDNPIIQEYLEADEYTVDLFLTLSGEVISAVPRCRLSTFGGESFVGQTRKHRRIIEESVRLGLALKLRGHNTIQCFDRDGEVQFIEVNPRFGGGANLGFAAGALTPSYLLREINGKNVEPIIGEFTDGLTMLRFTDDYFLNT